MIIHYKIELVEYHVYTERNSFYVWYDDHYVHDFTKISERFVIYKNNTKKKLIPYYKISCWYDDNELIGYSYSKGALRRKLQRVLKSVVKTIRLQISK